jgi:hypothetical protein
MFVNRLEKHVNLKGPNKYDVNVGDSDQYCINSFEKESPSNRTIIQKRNVELRETRCTASLKNIFIIN